MAEETKEERAAKGGKHTTKKIKKLTVLGVPWNQKLFHNRRIEWGRETKKKQRVAVEQLKLEAKMNNNGAKS